LKIELEKVKFSALPIEAIGHICFEPMVPVYQGAMRGHTAQDIRTDFYKSLSQGQRALFMFFSYYDHAIQSKDEFMRISQHYLSSQIFGAVKKGAEYFRDYAMVQLLTTVETVIPKNNQDDIYDLYKKLREISPLVLVRIGDCIKGNPAEFVSLV
jgi:hypothetical protein